MPITGNDELSLIILSELDKGMSHKEILLRYPVSLDQAKRLGRYRHMLKAVAENLSRHELEKVEQLGLKVLALSPLFKKADWIGLREVLDSISKSTTRNELGLLLHALEEKRKRVLEITTKMDLKLIELKKRESEMDVLKHELQSKQAALEAKVKFLTSYPLEARRFLLKHLGLYEGDLVLARRLDSNWQKSLKKQNIIRYDDLNYVWYVVNLDQLAAAYLRRIGWRPAAATEWDYEKEHERNQQAPYRLPDSPFYRLPNGLAQDLRSSIESIEGEIREIEAEREDILKEIYRLRKASPASFLESVKTVNAVAERDLITHGELQDLAMKWLYQQDYVVSSEVQLPNGRRCDVIGYNKEGRIVIIEAKASKADFLQDKKWRNYLPYCHEFYFLTLAEVTPLYYKNPECKGIGLLEKIQGSLRISEPFTRMQTVAELTNIHFSISKSLSRKYLYGI